MRPQQLQVAVTVRPTSTARPNELARTMAPHPRIHQELPYDPTCFLYNRRVAAANLNNLTAAEVYWRVHCSVILEHTGELPLVVRGPEPETLLNRVSYPRCPKEPNRTLQLSVRLYDHGGMITGGVLIRLADDRFDQADGDQFSWLQANARGLDVEVFDPGIGVSQVQGPHINGGVCSGN